MRLRNSGFCLLVLTMVLFTGPLALADGGGDGGGGGGDNSQVDFTGFIQGLPSTGMLFGDWQVSGVTVHVSGLTEIREDDGFAAIGATVEVRGVLRLDRSVDASRVEVKKSAGVPPSQQTEIVGTVGALPASGLTGDWTVGGRTVHVSASTSVDQHNGMAVVGATVDVRGTLRSDGSIDAASISVQPAVPGPQPQSFTGVVSALPASGLIGDWMVGTTTVHVTAATHIEGDGGIAVGATVEVRGTTEADHSVDATRIEVKSGAPAPGGGMSTHFAGAIETLPAGGGVGDWTVSGKTVHVSAVTKIESEHGVPVVGALVELTGTVRSDGSVDATEIEVRQSPQAGPGGILANVDLKGTVDVLASGAGFVGDWTVSGKTVHVTAATEVEQEDGLLAVGSMVEVKGVQEPDGSVDARKVEVVVGASGATMVSSNVWLVTSAARAGGRGDSFFTTDLTISNPGSLDALVQLQFLGHDKNGQNGPSTTLTVAAGATTTITDVLGSAFGLGDDFGAIRVTSNVPTLLVSASTSTPGGGGTFGQGMDASGRNDFVTSARARSVAGIRQDDRFRTNVVLANATESPVDVDAQLVSGTGVVLGTIRVHLEPLQMTQLNNAPQAFGVGGGLSGARILLSTNTRGGAFAASATVVDNQTNDPRALLAR